ncbi:MAG TPA: hypothetical protein VET48_13985 [Steroidobacteraceae bacterium]|nr:hypothetical protein [Steroidobacteraceae bacterium]
MNVHAAAESIAESATGNTQQAANVSTQQRISMLQIASPPIAEARSAVAKKPTSEPNKQSDSAKKRLTRKLVEPIRATWVELGRSAELLKAAQRFFRGNSSYTSYDDYLANRSFTGRAFDIGLNGAPTYSLTPKAPTLSTEHMSIDRFVVPNNNDTFESSITRHSATQLQVRMRGDWMMLYEVTRTSSTIAHDDIGVGFGLRRAF